MLAIKLLAEEIGIGGGVGAGLTFLGWLLLKRYGDRGWVTETWLQLPLPSLAVACYAVTQWVGGSGFIACFVGGLTFGALTKEHKEAVLAGAEGTGEAFSLVTWVVFGAAVVGQLPGTLDWRVAAYAVLSLTVVRMLPVFLGVLGLGVRTDAKLFLGWFGPRGLASIVFMVIVAGHELPGGDLITLTGVVTVVLSILAHGLTANPLSAAFGARRPSEPGGAG